MAGLTKTSKRGRELRAKAALARLDAAKVEVKEEKSDIDDGRGTESDTSDDEYVAGPPLTDNSGVPIKDEHGFDLFRVCGDEGEQGDGRERELDEFRRMGLSSYDVHDKQDTLDTSVTKNKGITTTGGRVKKTAKTKN